MYTRTSPVDRQLEIYPLLRCFSGEEDYSVFTLFLGGGLYIHPCDIGRRGD
jgi:hypothetical protein